MSSQSQPLDAEKEPLSANAEPSAAFTPGPWHVISDAQHPANRRITSKFRPHIAKVYATHLGDEIDGVSNARLIAAAPELLEALKQLSRCLLPIHMGLCEAELIEEPIPDNAVVLSFMGSGASDNVTAGEVRGALDAASAAIAKALGAPPASPTGVSVEGPGTQNSPSPANPS